MMYYFITVRFSCIVVRVSVSLYVLGVCMFLFVIY